MGKVGGSAPRYLHCRRKPKRRLKTRTQDNARCARRLSLFTVQNMQTPTHCEWGSSPYDNNIDAPGMVRQQGRRSSTHTTVKGMCVSSFFNKGIPTSQQCDAALHK
jgi:hypothetical protein